MGCLITVRLWWPYFFICSKSYWFLVCFLLWSPFLLVWCVVCLSCFISSAKCFDCVWFCDFLAFSAQLDLLPYIEVLTYVVLRLFIVQVSILPIRMYNIFQAFSSSNVLLNALRQKIYYYPRIVNVSFVFRRWLFLVWQIICLVCFFDTHATRSKRFGVSASQFINTLLLGSFSFNAMVSRLTKYNFERTKDVRYQLANALLPYQLIQSFCTRRSSMNTFSLGWSYNALRTAI